MAWLCRREQLRALLLFRRIGEILYSTKCISLDCKLETKILVQVLAVHYGGLKHPGFYTKLFSALFLNYERFHADKPTLFPIAPRRAFHVVLQIASAISSLCTSNRARGADFFCVDFPSRWSKPPSNFQKGMSQNAKMDVLF